MSSWKGLFLSPFFCLNRMLLSQITTYPSSSHPSRLSSVTIFSVRPTLSFFKIARWPLTGQASLVAQWQRVCLLMQEMQQVGPLSWEDPLEEGMATHSSILAWRIPWTEEPAWWATVHGVSKSWTRLSTYSTLWGPACPASPGTSLVLTLQVPHPQNLLLWYPLFCPSC